MSSPGSDAPSQTPSGSAPPGSPGVGPGAPFPGSHDGPPARSAAPGPRKTPIGLILLLVVGVPLLLLGAVGGLIAFFLLTASDLPVTDADRAVLFTVRDLAPYMDEAFVVDDQRETWSKERYLDFSFELGYAYDASGLYVASTVYAERNRSDAAMTYNSVRLGMLATLEVSVEGEFDTIDHSDELSWGEASQFLVLTADGAPFGNLFIGRRDDRVAFYVVSGVFFEDTRIFADLLRPILERVERYDP